MRFHLRNIFVAALRMRVTRPQLFHMQEIEANFHHITCYINVLS